MSHITYKQATSHTWTGHVTFAAQLGAVSNPLLSTPCQIVSQECHFQWKEPYFQPKEPSSMGQQQWEDSLKFQASLADSLKFPSSLCALSFAGESLKFRESPHHYHDIFYGLATMGRLPKFLGLFCKRALAHGKGVYLCAHACARERRSDRSGEWINEAMSGRPPTPSFTLSIRAHTHFTHISQLQLVGRPLNK